MSTLKIAIQKSGRLNEDSLQLLKDSGISINNGKDQLKVIVDNFPLEIFIFTQFRHSTILRRWNRRYCHHWGKFIGRKTEKSTDYTKTRILKM